MPENRRTVLLVVTLLLVVAVATAGAVGILYPTTAPARIGVLGVALGLIVAAAILFLHLTNPLVRALREQEERLRLMLASIPEGILAIDLDGRCTFANPAAARQLGYGEEQSLLGRNIHDLIHHACPDGSPHSGDECPAARAVIRGEPLQLDDEMLCRADGTGFPAEYRTRPLRRDGETVGAVVSFMDITERREQELELAHVQKMEVLGRLTGGIAHHFESLLTAVLANLRLLKRSPGSDGAESARLIDETISAAEDGACLTRQLLAFSREQTLEPVAVDMGDFLRESRRFLERVAAPGVEISVDTDATPMPVRVDIAQLRSALLSLTVNACEAMPAGGGLRIAARREQVGDRGGLAMPGSPAVALSISDTGEGMSAEALAMVPEPFFTTRAADQHSGLGLSMVYGFVRQSGGDLRIESEPGSGTTVTLYLPEAVEACPGSRIADLAERRATETATVLVVEGETRLRRFAARSLSDAGYRVLEASGAAVARALVMKHPEIRLLFSNIVMPGAASGIEFADWVKRHYPGISVLLTASNPYQADRAAKRGYRMLSKPYTGVDLVEAADQAAPAGGPSGPTP